MFERLRRFNTSAELGLIYPEEWHGVRSDTSLSCADC